MSAGFRYRTNRHYYLFVDRRQAGAPGASIASESPRVAECASWPQSNSRDTRSYYLLKVENEGPLIRALLMAKGSQRAIMRLPRAKRDSREFRRASEFRVSVSDSGKQLEDRIRKRDADLVRLREENPKPKL